MDQDALFSVAERCSGPAWDRLKALKQHPLFDIVVEALCQIEGTILELHVDGVFTTLVRDGKTARSRRRMLH